MLNVWKRIFFVKMSTDHRTQREKNAKTCIQNDKKTTTFTLKVAFKIKYSEIMEEKNY